MHTFAASLLCSKHIYPGNDYARLADDKQCLESDVSMSCNQVVRARGHDVRFDLVAADDDECNELSILHTGLYSDMNLMDHTFDSPKQVCSL